MAEAVKIQAETRDPKKNKGTGTRVARRLRATGRIPAILYGHKQAPQPISLSRELSRFVALASWPRRPAAAADVRTTFTWRSNGSPARPSTTDARNPSHMDRLRGLR